MKATLIYKLPEEQPDFDIACKAGDYYRMLWDIQEELRKNRKYDKTPEDCLLDIADIIKEFDNEI